MILIDDARFSIVLYNLISNSVKHTYGGQIKVSVKVLDQDQMDLKMRKCKSTKKAQAKIRAKNMRGVQGYLDNSVSSESSQEDDFNDENQDEIRSESNKFSTTKRGLEDTMLEHTSSKE